MKQRLLRVSNKQPFAMGGWYNNTHKKSVNCGFRPVHNSDNLAQRTPNHPLFLTPHLASLSSQFTHQQLFPGLKNVQPFSNMCACCTLKPPLLPSHAASTPASTANTVSGCTASNNSSPDSLTSSTSSLNNHDARTSSVAELRRKAQEHSAALLQSLQAAAAAGLAFSGLHLPPLPFHHHHPTLPKAANNNRTTNNIMNNNMSGAVHLKTEMAQDMTVGNMKSYIPVGSTNFSEIYDLTNCQVSQTSYENATTANIPTTTTTPNTNNVQEQSEKSASDIAAHQQQQPSNNNTINNNSTNDYVLKKT